MNFMKSTIGGSKTSGDSKKTGSKTSGDSKKTGSNTLGDSKKTNNSLKAKNLKKTNNSTKTKSSKTNDNSLNNSLKNKTSILKNYFDAKKVSISSKAMKKTSSIDVIYRYKMVLFLLLLMVSMVGISVLTYKVSKEEKKEAYVVSASKAVKVEKKKKESTALSKKEAMPDYSDGIHDISEDEARKIIKEYADEHGLDASIYSDALVKLLSRHLEAKDFVLNYPYEMRLVIPDESYKSISEDATAGDSISDDINPKGGKFTEVPKLYQWDPKWGYKVYGADAMGLTGCGPTSLSMVAMYLLQDKTMTPDWMADFSDKNGYCVDGDGTSWTLMSEGSVKLGLSVKKVTPVEDIMARELLEGRPIICVLGPGKFTDNGHYIVLSGYKGEENDYGVYEDGEFIMNDSNCIENSQRTWKFDEFAEEIEGMWSYGGPNE